MITTTHVEVAIVGGGDTARLTHHIAGDRGTAPRRSARTSCSDAPGAPR